MPGVVVDGHDPIAVFEVVEAAIDRARQGEGPSLIEAKLLRWEPHAHGIADTRSDEEMSEARRRDGVTGFREILISMEIIPELALSDIEAECQEEVEAAVDELRNTSRQRSEPTLMSREDAWNVTYASQD